MEVATSSLNKSKPLPESSSSKHAISPVDDTCGFEGILRSLCVFRQRVNPAPVTNNHSMSYS